MYLLSVSVCVKVALCALIRGMAEEWRWQAQADMSSTPFDPALSEELEHFFYEL